MSRDPSTLPSPGIKTPALDKQAAEITYEGVSELASPSERKMATTPPPPLITPQESGPLQKPKEVPLRRRLELTRFSYMAINRVDCIEQQFRACIFFELRFPGGANDPDLNADGDEFPPPREDGRLPRPPAGWYMNQIDIKNFIEHTDPLNANVVRRDGDILLSMRFEGDFHESMEMGMFPFDMQELSVDIAINCRTSGILPVDFVVARDAHIGCSRDGFALHQVMCIACSSMHPMHVYTHVCIF